MSTRILTGDMRERLRDLPDASIDSVVTDPPYHLTSIVKRFGASNAAPPKSGKTGAYSRASRGFMGQTWDGGDVAFRTETWAEVLRVMKPGAHLLAFSGTRTYHRMVCAIEDAGFDIRDQLAWVYGSGFPKSLNVGKAIEAQELTGGSAPTNIRQQTMGSDYAPHELAGTPGFGDGFAPGSSTFSMGAMGAADNRGKAGAPLTTEAAQQWQGWGTALKPSWESICLAQKPYDFRQLSGILARKITEAICQLPSLAKDAEPSSWLSQSVFVEEFGSAQWSAVAECNTPDALFDLMATLPSASALPSSLSTAFSWLNTLAAVSTLESTFTTETASSLTTDLRTLNSLLSKNTPATIAAASIPLSGEPCVAALVASLFSGVEARLRFTRELSALDPATLQDHTSSPDGIAPNLTPICLARKPLVGTVAANVLQHGTGALNIDGCRIPTDDGYTENAVTQGVNTARTSYAPASARRTFAPSQEGRWPANVIHDGSDEVVEAFPDTKMSTGGGGVKVGVGLPGDLRSSGHEYAGDVGFGDSGSAARFFYSAKADQKERHAGCEDLEKRNSHPTVKPIDLMRWLIRLVTPRGGLVLDPFMGSGSTLIAAHLEQCASIGIEMNPQYVEIARRRIAEAQGLFVDVEVAA